MKNNGNKTTIKKKKVRQEKKGTTVSTGSKMYQIPKVKYGKSRTEVKNKKDDKDTYVEKKNKTQVKQGIDITKKDPQEKLNNNKIEIKKEGYIPYSCIEKLEENDMTCDEQMQ